jgi:hypothetical protein
LAHGIHPQNVRGGPWHLSLDRARPRSYRILPGSHPVSHVYHPEARWVMGGEWGGRGGADPRVGMNVWRLAPTPRQAELLAHLTFELRLRAPRLLDCWACQSHCLRLLSAAPWLLEDASCASEKCAESECFRPQIGRARDPSEHETHP